ncbi:MAG TPA: M4 family metallopeptidase [Gammaproteobacteria bacterium]|jgi:pseudolysin|nr:M4 family metallopeptidase [Gammaproteobacteria bacterium]
MKFRLSILMTGLILANVATAATEVNLRMQPASYMQKQLSSQNEKVKFKTIRTDVDFNNTAHTRIQQMYDGIPVWNATGVIHSPNAGKTAKRAFAPIHDNTTMNGVIYENLEKDLRKTSALTFNKTSQQKALLTAKNSFTKKFRAPVNNFTNEKSQMIIFVDDNKQAHYAYLTSFDYYTANSATRPTSIVDAATQKVYRTWEGLYFANSKEAAIAAARAKFAKSLEDQDDDKLPEGVYEIIVGGIGGNIKSGEIVYDGKQTKEPNAIARDFDWEMTPGMHTKFTMCALWNKDIRVLDVAYDNEKVVSTCIPNFQQHNNVHWMNMDKGLTRWNNDEMNDGYSPSLDAFYAAQAIKNMYQDWYNVPALIDQDGKPMKYTMRVHFGRKFDNAFWDGRQMTFGDGGTMFYPMSSLGVAAHEISHGFTDTYSHISGEYPQMGALHESFSDMAAIATENYTTGTNGWDLGREVMKNEGALRYLDNPTKDGSSIDHMKDFDETEAHGGAGITNKAFYLMATSKGWNTHKAFDVWVKANMHYWNSSMQTLGEAACGVVAATKDYGYNVADVRIAFAKVGIDTDTCQAAS